MRRVVAPVRPSLVPLLASLALLSILAGCTSTPPAPTPPKAPEPMAAPSFAPTVRLPAIPPGAGEPSTAILPDGTLFVTAPSGASKPNAHEGGAYLWRSTDGGHSWDVLRAPYVNRSEPQAPVAGDPAEQFCSCDADVVASPDGWVYYADWWIAGPTGSGNYLVEASGDGGKTWSVDSVPIPENIAASMDREWLVAGPGGFVGLFYSFFGAVGTPVAGLSPPVPALGLDRPGDTIQAVFSTDHGKTWTDPVIVVQQDPKAGDQIGHPFLLPNGTLAMAYGKVFATNEGNFWYDRSEVRLATSPDHGKTWGDALVAEVPDGFDNLWAIQGTADPSTGEVTVAWAARSDNRTVLETQSGGLTGSASSVRNAAPDSRMGLFVKQWGPLGEAGPVLVRGNGTNVLPWVAARGGAAAVSWYGGDATGDMTKANADWFAYAALAPKGLFTAGNFTVAKVSDAPVKHGALCAKGGGCPNNRDRQLFDFGSLVLDAAGRLHVSLTRVDGGVPYIETAAQT